jgi:hypothetical protein
VLLYVKGLDLPPVLGLSLAARSLEEAPSSPEGAMDALERLLREECFSPDMNRAVMVAEEMDRLPWRTSLLRFLRRWSRELFGGKTNG